MYHTFKDGIHFNDFGIERCNCNVKLQIFCSWALNILLLLPSAIAKYSFGTSFLQRAFARYYISTFIFLFKSIRTSNGNYRLNKTPQVSNILLDIRLECNGLYLYMEHIQVFPFCFRQKVQELFCGILGQICLLRRNGNLEFLVHHDIYVQGGRKLSNLRGPEA